MLKESFSSIFNKNHYLVVENSEGVLNHLTHLEELILTKKKHGVELAATFIKELLKTFQGHSNEHVFTTVKYDGAPAVIVGYNPENNQFFISTKSLGNVEPKINYTEEDIERNHGAAPGLVKKLKLGLQYLPEVIKSGIYQGDFMFDSDTLGSYSKDGINYITFKPNTITYAVPEHTPEGERIKNAKVGVVLHTSYSGPSLTNLHKKFGVSVADFPKSKDVWLEDALFKDLTGTVTLTEEEVELINNLLDSIESSKNVTKWDSIPEIIYTGLNTYINVLIREHRFVTDPEQSLNEFIKWFYNRTNKEIDKLKTPSGKEKKRAARDKIVDDINKEQISYINIFNLTKKIEQAKMFFVHKYNAAIKTKQFITNEQGDLVLTDPEGYVAVDHIGNAVKLVNRLEFSRANFAVSKGEKFK
jgi:Family of unknown function (DUF6267)